MKYNLIERKPTYYWDLVKDDFSDLLRDTLSENRFFVPIAWKHNDNWLPAVEIKQCDKQYKVSVQLPGVNKEDIKVDLDDDFMTISTEMKKEELNEGQSVKSSEFRYGRYERTISFDSPIDVENADATYKNGILTITVPKRKDEENKKKHLEIKD